MLVTAIMERVMKSVLGGIVSGAAPGGAPIETSSGASNFGGGFAAGGSVMAGMPILVGEKRPEIFVPSSSGTILPNAMLGGGVNFKLVVNNESSQKVDAYASKPRFDAEGIVVDVIMKDAEQHGPISQMFGR